MKSQGMTPYEKAKRNEDDMDDMVDDYLSSHIRFILISYVAYGYSFILI